MCLDYLENNERNRIWALYILDAICNGKSKRKHILLPTRCNFICTVRYNILTYNNIQNAIIKSV